MVLMPNWKAQKKMMNLGHPCLKKPFVILYFSLRASKQDKLHMACTFHRYCWWMDKHFACHSFADPWEEASLQQPAGRGRTIENQGNKENKNNAVQVSPREKLHRLQKDWRQFFAGTIFKLKKRNCIGCFNTYKMIYCGSLKFL